MPRACSCLIFPARAESLRLRIEGTIDTEVAKHGLSRIRLNRECVGSRQKARRRLIQLRNKILRLQQSRRELPGTNAIAVRLRMRMSSVWMDDCSAATAIKTTESSLALIRIDCPRLWVELRLNKFLQRFRVRALANPCDSKPGVSLVLLECQLW